MSIINTLVKGGGGGTVEVTTNTLTRTIASMSQTAFSVSHEPTEWFIFYNSSYTTTEVLPDVGYIGEVGGAYKAYGVFRRNSDGKGYLTGVTVDDYVYSNGTFTVSIEQSKMPFKDGTGNYTLIYI